MTRKTTFKKKWGMILLILILFLAGIQFIRPAIDTPPVTGDFTAPPQVKEIIERACYDCHSNKTNLAWFDQPAPAYWLVRNDIIEARKVLNFSTWDSLPADQQKGKLFESLNQVEFKEMPLKQYVLLHHDAKVTSSEIVVLKNYLDTLVPVRISDPARIAAADTQYRKWIGAIRSPDNTAAAPSSIKPSPNGIPYNPGYKNWTAISTTERFDNGTLRVIMGNETAVKAIKDNHINPWPNGTQFAKIAWKAAMDSSGIVHAGEFLQVEFMIKDSEKYAATEGWGWGRWKGMQLKPYGANALFTTECTGCHRPLHDNDFVFTSPLHLSAKN
jgi:hypothetical protein